MKTRILERFLDEFIVYGGPVVTRREALADMRARGFEWRAIDISVFGRQPVEAPTDPAAEVAFLRRIQEMLR